MYSLKKKSTDLSDPNRDGVKRVFEDWRRGSRGRAPALQV
jgi:hypothetical protein